MASRQKSRGRRAQDAAAAAAPEVKETADAAGTADVAVEEAGDDDDSAPEVGESLRRLRNERGLSLEKLAQLAGVSRAMLGQIELGQSTPTIRTLFKISRALNVPFSALLSDKNSQGTLVLRAAQTRRLTNEKGTFVSRALFPLGGPRRVEFYELKLAAGCEERAVPHTPGTTEMIAVNRGQLEVGIRGETHTLGEGDVISFEADAPHVYRNLTNTETLAYLVMTYNYVGE